MLKVSDILKAKGPEVYTVDCSETAYNAVSKMTDKSVGALVVCDGEKICGIVSERDCLRKVTLKDLDPRKTKVEEIMTSKVIIAEPGFTVDECMAIMTEKRIRHLPIVAGKEMVGIVSIGDLVKHTSKVQQAHIEYLTDFITGKYPA